MAETLKDATAKGSHGADLDLPSGWPPSFRTSKTEAQKPSGSIPQISMGGRRIHSSFQEMRLRGSSLGSTPPFSTTSGSPRRRSGTLRKPSARR